ncbi:MAG: beta-propeller domain-containing protein, partial [Firmicutes bacterium]|nr:beta-propeller domain-containing protein [Bacillota bacterium]
LSLSVVDPDNMTVRAKIDYENFRPTELYLPKSQEGKLVVTGTCFDEPLYKRFKRSRYYPAARIAVNDCAYYPYYVHNSVMVKIYDIAGLLEAGSAGASDEGAYTPERELKFKNATLNTSRIANGTLYLIVNYGAMYSDNFVYPALQDSENGTYDIPASSILMMSAPKYYYYNLMFAIAIDLDGGQTGVQGFVGYGWINYCTEQSLYFAMSRYEYETETINGQTYYSHYRYTDIVRFSIDEAKIEYAGKFIADGYLKDQFGMSEYAGFLRVATTVDNRGTGSGWQNVTDCIITTLRISDLSEAGRIGGLGKPGERIYASRFYGDRAVVVTYRQTDPLSVVDLSDPREPEILVQFIIDGVSDYLQFFTEDLVFSIGRGEESPGRLGDVKTELYYIDDDFIATAETPSLACYMLNSGGNSWTSASYDYKAILHYQNLYAFPVTSYSYTWDSQYYTYKSESLLYLYTITGEGADAKMAQAALAYKGDDFFCGNKGGDYYFGIYVDNLRRAVIIGEHIYLVGTNKIQRYVYANVLAGTLGTPATVKIV